MKHLFAVVALVVLSALTVQAAPSGGPKPATWNNSGSLTADLPVLNRTHLKLQTGAVVNAQILNATDPGLAGLTNVTVFIKRSDNTGAAIVDEVSGAVTSNGTTYTISFTYTAPPAYQVCQTSMVAYGVVGNGANAALFGDGTGKVAGFAFTDANGNVLTCNVGCTLTTPPVFMEVGADFEVECGDLFSFSQPTAYDAEGTQLIATYGDVTTQGSCAGTYSVTRTWTTTDRCNNTATAQQTITVKDTKAPELAGLPVSTALSFACYSEVPSAETVTATDACGGTIAVVYAETQTVPGSSCQNTITRTWTATDACGNVASFTQTITVNDDQAPTFAGLPEQKEVAVKCYNAVPPIATVTATDNCSGSVEVTFSETQTAQGSSCQNTITRTWSAKDACGNEATYTQTITVNDDVAPTITAIDPIVVDIYDGCAAVVPFTPVAQDNCGGAVTITSVPASGSSFPVGVTTVKVTATDACGNAAEFSFTVTVRAHILVTKFFDANANGIKDDAEATIPGWQFSINGRIYETSSNGSADIALTTGGPYAVTELFPTQTNWMATTVKTYTFECGGTAVFGNLCLGAGGGLTLGFWSNKNGEKTMLDGGTVLPELAMLSARNLRNANGSAFDPATYSGFRTWILNATATNMAYMLSAQMAAMELNVEAGFVSSGAIVYAPGVGSGYVTIADLLLKANTSLGTDGLVLDGNSVRSYQEALKNALDKANNNLNFVQASACPVTWTTTVTAEVKASNSSSATDGLAQTAKSVEESHVVIPSEYALGQNYPNPFNPSTQIRLSLPEASTVTLKIYDLLGREVSTIVNGGLGAGIHTFTWNGMNASGATVPSGVYLYRVEARSQQSTAVYHQTRRLVMMK